MKKFFGLIICTAFMATTALSAATITLEGASGIWTNTAPGSGISGVGTNKIMWGTSTGSGQSGYLFEATSTPVNLTVNTPFSLGDFTHINFPIKGTSLTSADLVVTADLNINGTLLNGLNFTYNFLHNETPNGKNGCCDDEVTFLNNALQSDIFTVDGVKYTLEIAGFQQNGQLVDTFFTKENKRNTAGLIGVIKKSNLEVPEPGTYLMLGSVLVVTGCVARKRSVRAS